MTAFFSLHRATILLLAQPDSFSAAYVRRSLEMTGVTVLAPDGPPERALAAIDPAEWASISACIAIDLGKALLDSLPPEQRDIPFVFIGQDPGEWFAGPYSWLCPPFAAFQVVELLSDMIVAAGRTMQASLNIAASA